MKNRICLLAWIMIALALTSIQNHAQSICEPYTFTTLAGLAGSPFEDYGLVGPLEGRKVSVDGSGSAARFWHPSSVAGDNAGNLYVADNGTIRKVTPAGVVTTLAGLAGVFGNADGTGTAARFCYHSGVELDSASNVYVADSENNTIRKVTPAGVVTTMAGLAGSFGSTDGTGSAARFASPQGVAVDSAGNLYVADYFNATIRQVTPAGVVTTLAGLAGENGSAAGFGLPSGLAVDSMGNVYVGDSLHLTIRKVTPAGVVTTLAGLAGEYGSADGTGSEVRFGLPNSIPPFTLAVAVGSAGNLYVADKANNTIRKGYPAPRILNSGPGFGFNGGLFGFNLTGPTGRSVVVETSRDLVSWLPLWTNTFTFPAALNFSDPQSGFAPTRFYRARLPYAPTKLSKQICS